ncbi:hypothetical protein D3C86_1952770 [compost metagenome]
MVVVAYKVAKGSYTFGKFCGRVGGAVEILLANGYTQEQINVMGPEEMEDAINNLGAVA